MKQINNKIYLSIETSGLNPIDFKIIEIAALKIDEHNNKSLFHKLINPQQDLSDEAIKLTLMNNEDLKKQKSIVEIKNDFLNFIGSTNIVVHNKEFIMGFLDKEFEDEIKNEIVDINEIFKNRFPNESSSFSSILEKFNLKIETSFSDTLNEVLLLPNVYQILLDK